jgi:hypothetical protein
MTHSHSVVSLWSSKRMMPRWGDKFARTTNASKQDWQRKWPVTCHKSTKRRGRPKRFSRLEDHKAPMDVESQNEKRVIKHEAIRVRCVPEYTISVLYLIYWLFALQSMLFFIRFNWDFFNKQKFVSIHAAFDQAVSNEQTT